MKRKYIKPSMIKFSDDEMRELIFAAASGGTYLASCSTGPHNCSITVCSLPH